MFPELPEASDSPGGYGSPIPAARVPESGMAGDTGGAECACRIDTSNASAGCCRKGLVHQGRPVQREPTDNLRETNF